MSEKTSKLVSERLFGNFSRRELLVNTGRAAAVTALAGVAVPHVHAAQSETIQLRSSVAADAALARPAIRCRAKTARPN